MAVAQLVVRLLLTPEISSLYPDIGKILPTNCTIKMMKIAKKRPGMAHLFKKETVDNPKGGKMAKKFSIAVLEVFCQTLRFA